MQREGQRPIEKAFIGQVVMLRSGGPHMTVHSIRPGEQDEPDQVRCIWHLGGDSGPITDFLFLSSCLDEIIDESEETL